MDPRTMRGAGGEAAAAACYRERGYRILERNWRCRAGEIDLIVARRGVVVICEVKTRTGVRFGGGFEAVGWEKQRRLRRLAEVYLASTAEPVASVRFDVASVAAGADGWDVEIFDDAF
jgi:putative endonuclease